MRTAIAPAATVPPTATPTIIPVFDFEDEGVGVGDCVPVFPPNVIEAGGVVDMTAVEVACVWVAVDSGASTRHIFRRWLRYHNEHTSCKLSDSCIEIIGFLLRFEHQKSEQEM